MQYIGFIQCEGFYVRALGLDANPESQSPTLIVRDDRVLDATATAFQMGVRLGMRSSEARAVLDGQGIVMGFEPSAYAQAQEAWLEVVATFSDTIEPGLPHEAFVDLSRHPRPDTLIQRLRRALERRTGGPIRIGSGRSRWLARLTAQLGDPKGLALFCPELYVADLPTDFLSEITPAHRERLITLGYRKIGQVAELELDVLRKLFSDDAYAIHLATRGIGDSHIRAEFPKGAISTDLWFDGAPQDWMTLECGLHEVAERLGTQLQERALSGQRMEMILEFEDGGLRLLKRAFMKPITDARTCFCATKLLLSRLPEAPVVGVRLRALDLSRSKHAQLGLDGMKSKLERERNALAAMMAIRQVFGDQSVELASTKSTPRRRQVLSAWKDAYGWR